MITLLRKGGRHVWEDLLKILARALANRLQLVISDLIGPEQNYAVKRRSIPNNLPLVCEILEGIKDDAEATLINLDQSKAFDRVDHHFLATILETARFKPEFRKWISILYHHPLAMVQVNGERSKAFDIEHSVWQGFPLSPLLYVLALEPLFRRLRDEGHVRPCVEFLWLAASELRSLRTPMILLFLCPVVWQRRRRSRGTRWQVPKSTLTRAKVCGWVLVGVTDPSSSLGCGSDQTSCWSEIGWKYGLR